LETRKRSISVAIAGERLDRRMISAARFDAARQDAADERVGAERGGEHPEILICMGQLARRARG
jgi:hypothetical protein